MSRLRAETARREALRLAPARRLHPLERLRLLAEIVGAYVSARRVLRRSPIEGALAVLRSHPQVVPSAGARANLAEAGRLGRAVSRTLALLPGDTRCLTRSLVLSRLLARRGIPAKLVIGARTAPGFVAHAWVECDGLAVLTPGDGSFGRLVEL